MNKYEDAIAVLAELLQRDPENVAAMKMKGILFMRMQDYKKATQLFKELTTIAPDVEVYQHLGDSLMALGQMEAALDALHQSLALDSQNGATYMRLADVHEKSKQYVKAYMCLRRAAQCGADRKRCAEDARIAKARIHARRFPRRAS